LVGLRWKGEISNGRKASTLIREHGGSDPAGEGSKVRRGENSEKLQTVLRVERSYVWHDSDERRQARNSCTRGACRKDFSERFRKEEIAYIGILKPAVFGWEIGRGQV